MIGLESDWRSQGGAAMNLRRFELEKKWGGAPKRDVKVECGVMTCDGQTLDLKASDLTYRLVEFMSKRRTVTLDEIAEHVWYKPIDGRSMQFSHSMRTTINSRFSVVRRLLQQKFGGEWLVSVNPKIFEYALEPSRIIFHRKWQNHIRKTDRVPSQQIVPGLTSEKQMDVYKSIIEKLKPFRREQRTAILKAIARHMELQL